MLRFDEQIEKQILDALHMEIAFLAKMRETHQIYQDFVDERGIESFEI